MLKHVHYDSQAIFIKAHADSDTHPFKKFSKSNNQLLPTSSGALHVGVTLVIGSVFLMFDPDGPPTESHTMIRVSLCHSADYCMSMP